MRSLRMPVFATATLVGFVVVLLAIQSRTSYAQDEAGDATAAEEESGDVTADGVTADGEAADGEAADGEAADGEAADSASTPAGTGEAPVRVRLRQLEQRVQSLKERAWRSKARVGMLKESVLGGGLGAQATLVHRNKMGRAFILEKLVYAIDGTQVLARQDDELADEGTIDILSGPISPGNHTISVLIVYRGSGFGPFKYLKKYRFTVKSSHTFTAAEGKATRIDVVGYEKGGFTTELRDRPAVEFKVSTGDQASAE